MSLSDIPSQMATYFDISLTTAQIIISVIVIFAILLPTMVLARGKNAVTIWIISIFLGQTITLGLGWSPFWITIMFMVLGAMSVALFGAKQATGG